MEVASQGDSLASIGAYGFNPPPAGANASNYITSFLTPATVGGMIISTGDTSVEYLVAVPVTDTDGSSPATPYFTNFQGNPTYVYAGNAYAGDGVSWTWNGSAWVGTATIELTHYGSASGGRSHLIDGSASICHSGYRAKVRLHKVGGYYVQ